MPDHDDRPLPVHRIDLVAIDVDGTLLGPDGSISPATVAAVRDVVAAGKRVVLATARPPRGIVRLCQTLGLTSLQVNHNGALIYDPVSRQVAFHQPLAGPLARQVIEVVRRHDPTAAVGVEVVDRLWLDRPTTQAVDRVAQEPSLTMTGVSTAGPGQDGLEQALQGQVTKVMALGEAGPLASIQQELAQRGRGRVSFAFSHMRLLQIVHAQADKARALQRVCDHYGIAASAVMAIGDAPNDLPMMRWAGLAMAVGDAWDVVKAAAHLVVGPSGGDGVAAALRRHVLEG